MPKTSISSLFFAIALSACANLTAPATAGQPEEDVTKVSCGSAEALTAQLDALQPSTEEETPLEADGALVDALTACLGASDPVLRDKIGYEGLTRLLRSGQVSDALQQDLRLQLMANMSPELPDPEGVRRPFSILVLAEIVRADRVSPYLSDDERMAVLDTAIGYLYQLSDFRDYDDAEGWRHGVAHAADLMMQAVLNPAYERTAHLMIVETAFMKARALNHGYTAGEGERLARPVLFAANAGLISEEEWDGLFADLMSPSPLLEWKEAFRSKGGLNRMHNIKALLHAIYFTANQQEDDKFKTLAQRAADALIELP